MGDKNRCKIYSTRKIVFLVWSVLVLSIVTNSCDSDKVGAFEHPGVLQLGLSADTAGIPGDQEITKAVLSELEAFLNTDQYQIEILQGEEETVVSSFDHYKDMPDLVELERGNYRIRASMGEQKPAAFEAPRFEGVSDFIIKENMTTKLNITCALANARVAVAYTDSFKVVYPTYSLAVTTSHTTEPFEFVQDETRPGWFQVNADGEDLKGILTVKPDTGEIKQYAVTIPSVKPKDNVKLTFNSTPNTRPDQGLTVKITINDEVIDVPVYVYIPDYMLPVDGVNVQLNEFSSGTVQVVKKGVDVRNYSVDITAPGTIGKCLLTITKKEGTPKTYDLANLTEEERYYLSNTEKLVWDSMSQEGGKRVKKASISFKKLVEELQNDIPEEEIYLYEYSLTVQDSLKVPHSSEPQILKIKVYPDNAPYLEPVEFQNATTEVVMEKSENKNYSVNIKAPNKIDKCLLTIFRDGVQMGEVIDLNNNVPEGMTYMKSEDGKTASVNYKDLIPLLKSGIDTAVEYKYSLVVVDQFPDEPFISDPMVLQVNVTPYIKVYVPRGDIWTNRAKIIMELANDVIYPVQFEYRDEYSNWMPINGISDVEGKIVSIILSGLKAGDSYKIRAKYNDKVQSSSVGFLTEQALQLPNAGFEQWHNYAEGYWKRWYPWSNEENEQGWNTLNEKTTSAGGSTTTNYAYVSNSGTLQTSDHSEGTYAALIRTIGWGKGTTAPGNAWVTKWDGEMKKIDPGYLYTGKYLSEYKDQNIKPEDKWEAMQFSSRPKAISFKYKYTPASSRKTSDDRFVVRIVIENKSNGVTTVLSEQQITEGGKNDEFIFKQIDIEYKIKDLEATNIFVMFKSGREFRAENKEDYDYFTTPGYNNLSDGEYVGSKLIIDDVQLIYE